LKRFPFEPAHRFPVDEHWKGPILSLAKREHLDRRLGGQGQIGWEKEGHLFRSQCRLAHQDQQEEDRKPSPAQEDIDHA
jgi:hypothetical protein